MKKRNIHYKLIVKCKRGNSKAQFEIYKLYYKAMYNTSLRIVQDTAEAEDVMQESFLSAFNKLGTWSEDVEFGAWLKKIVINKSLDFLKKRKMKLSELEDKYIQLPNSEIEIIENTQGKINLIKDAVNKLPEKDRIILLMYLFEGYDHNEIGSILNIKPGTVRSQYSRAKEKLQVLINKNKIHYKDEYQLN